MTGRIAVLCFGLAAAIHAQVAPEAVRGVLSTSVGLSASHTSIDGAVGGFYGATAWADLHLHLDRPALAGLSLEATATDRRTGSPEFDNVAVKSQTVFAGGPVWRWNHYERFRPFAEFMAGLGFTRFEASCCRAYTHDKREVWSFGGGADWITSQWTAVRIDYRREYWPALFTPNALVQQSIEIGASYQLHRIRRSF